MNVTGGAFCPAGRLQPPIGHFDLPLAGKSENRKRSEGIFRVGGSGESQPPTRNLLPQISASPPGEAKGRPVRDGRLSKIIVLAGVRGRGSPPPR